MAESTAQQTITHTDAVRAAVSADPIQQASIRVSEALADYENILASRAAQMAGAAVLGVLTQVAALEARIAKLEAELAARP